MKMSDKKIKCIKKNEREKEKRFHQFSGHEKQLLIEFKILSTRKRKKERKKSLRFNTII